MTTSEDKQHYSEDINVAEEAKMHEGHKDQSVETKEEPVLRQAGIPHEYEDIVEQIESLGEDCKAWLKDYLNETPNGVEAKNVMDQMHSEMMDSED